MATETAFGIDLGTTFSVVSHLDANGRPWTISSTEGEGKTPSVVFFDKSEFIVGREALKAAEFEPERVARFVKREMGRHLSRGALFQIETGAGRQFPPEVIQAMILQKLKRDAELKLGDANKVVITVPAYFDEPRRKATQDAGRIAGLDVLDIINEPTAAAVCYGVQQQFLTAEGESRATETILVYDLGGGTFDATLMEIDGRHYATLATGGDVYLGGVDWDKRLADHLAEQFKSEHGVDLRDDPCGHQRLLLEAEAAKHALSAREETTVMLSHEGNRSRIPVTREKFLELTADLLDRTAFTVKKVLREAGIQWSDVTRLLLVGGSTRMPAVQEMLERESGLKVDRSLSPDEAVAHGAAIYAGLLIRHSAEALKDLSVSNVNSHDLGVVGVETASGRKRRHVMIPRNTRLPAKKSNRFVTYEDGQTSVLVNVVEGGDSTGENATAIGKCIVRDLPANLPKGTKVVVQFRYSQNGRLHVVANLPEIDKQATVTIERASGLSKDEIEHWRQQMASGELLKSTAAANEAPAKTQAAAAMTPPPVEKPKQKPVAPPKVDKPKSAKPPAVETNGRRNPPEPKPNGMKPAAKNGATAKSGAPKPPPPPKAAKPEPPPAQKSPPSQVNRLAGDSSAKPPLPKSTSRDAKQPEQPSQRSPSPPKSPPKPPGDRAKKAVAASAAATAVADADEEKAVAPPIVPPASDEPTATVAAATTGTAVAAPPKLEPTERPHPAEEPVAEEPHLEVTPEDEEKLEAVPSHIGQQAAVFGVSFAVHLVALLILAFVVFPSEIRDAVLGTVSSLPDPPKPKKLEEVKIEKPKEVMDDEQEAQIVKKVLADNNQKFEIDVDDINPPSATLDNNPNAANPAAQAPNRGKYAGRSKAGRAALLAKYGGNAASEGAVRRGLEWLKRHKASDGGWAWDHTHRGCNCPKPGTLKRSRLGATAMALMCFLGHGDTFFSGDYQPVVRDGLMFMLKHEKKDKSGQGTGDFRGDFEGNAGMYIQGLATITLCEAFAMNQAALEASHVSKSELRNKSSQERKKIMVSRRQRQKDARVLGYAALRAIYFVVRAQSDSGGWRYTPNRSEDTSVVGWQIMALASGHSAKIRIPAETLQGAERYLATVQADEYGSRYKYVPGGGGPRPTMSAVGLLSRIYMGWKRTNPGLSRGVESLSGLGPSRNNMYYNYYATQVMHQYGGPMWKKWNEVMRDQLVDTQRKDGHARGSWDVTDPHGAKGGRLYQTCLCIMTLEVYYRHLPLYTHRNIDDDSKDKDGFAGKAKKKPKSKKKANKKPRGKKKANRKKRAKKKAKR